MTPPTGQHLNRFLDPHVKPQWAELTRLAGDRAAMLLEDLRKLISRIDGLREELHYYGPDQGWAPRYSVGERELFRTYILPGVLEAALTLDEPSRQMLLASPKLARSTKQTISNALVSDGVAQLGFTLSNSAEVRSFANLIRLKSKLLAGREAE